MDTRLQQLSLASLNEAECPEPDRIAAYILGTLSGHEQLVVAAHVRTCPLCQDDITACRPPAPRPRLIIGRLLPMVLDGARSAPATTNVRRYLAADLTIDLTISPPVGETWRITGQVVRAGAGVSHSDVVLRSRRRRYQDTSDEQGYFTFEDLPVGRFTLTVTEGQTQVQLRGLILGDAQI